MTRPSLLIIVGMVRSGSTYLEGRIADLYSGVAVGELVGAWGAFRRDNLLCSCGERATDCAFWGEVRSRYCGLDDLKTVRFMTETNAAVMPVRRMRQWRRILSGHLDGTLLSYRREGRDLVAAVAAVADEMGYQIVVDSSKHPMFYALVHSEPHLKVARQFCARVVRDPRGVAYSLTRPKVEATSDGAGFAMKGYARSRGLPFWLAMNEASDRVVPDDAVLFRYEDLAAEPFRPWLEGAGLAPKAGGVWHQLVSNPVRQSGTAGFRLDERWRESSRVGSTAIGAALWPWMRRYGYSVRA